MPKVAIMKHPFLLTRRLCACVLVALVSLSPADAKKREVTVPVEVGVGPAANIISGEMQERQTFFYGARINLEAVIDKALIKKYKKRIPKKYRKMAMQLDEVRFRPAPLSYIPKTLYISPGENAMYGAMWDLFGVGTRLGPLKASADLQFAYAYLSYQAMDKAESAQSMHLLRPAIGLTAHIPLMLTDSVGFDIGWRSTLMPPQELGGSPLSFTEDLDGSIWHIGQAYVAFTYRMPYTTRL